MTTRTRRTCARASSRACRKAASASRPISRDRCSSSPRKRPTFIPVTSFTPTAAIRRVSEMAKARIAVVGAGLMGHGIAQVFALAGHDVAITDSVAQNLETSKARIAANLRDLGDDERAAERVTPLADLA